jgi:hypothetical protein
MKHFRSPELKKIKKTVLCLIYCIEASDLDGHQNRKPDPDRHQNDADSQLIIYINYIILVQCID